MFLKQSTASQVIELGPFVDDTDFKTAETALTIANTDIKLRKAGGTTHGNKNSGGATHIANGYYYATLDATDTDTVGPLDVHVNASGALPVWARFYVLEEAVFDALMAASAPGYVANAPVNVAQFGGSNGTFSGGRPEVNTTHVGGTVQTAGNLASLITAVDDYVDLEVAAIAADVTTLLSRVGTPSNLGGGASLAANLVDIEGQTDDIGAAGAGLTGIPWNPAWDAEVQSEVQDAIEANHLDHLLAATYDPAAKPGAADALLNELVESDAGVARFTANALEQGPGGGSAPTAAQIADAVWDEALADHLTAGSTGAGLNAAGSAGDPWSTSLPGAYGAGTAGNILGNRLVGTIASGTHNPQSGDAFARLGAPAGASVSADIAGVQADTNDIQTRLPAALVGGRMDANVGAISADSAAADNAEAFFDGTGYAGTGNTIPTVTTVTNGVTVATNNDKTGYSLSAAGIQAVWDALTSALTTVGSVGKLLVDNINATISSRLASASYSAPLDATGTRTAVGLASANLDTQLSAIAGYIDTEIAAILLDTGTTLDDLVDDLETRLTAALADKLTAHAAAVLKVVVGTGSTTTTVKFSTVEGGAPSSVNDFYNGRVIIFTSGALAGQATDITDYDGASTTATVTALTGAPANTVTAIIV